MSHKHSLVLAELVGLVEGASGQIFSTLPNKYQHVLLTFITTLYDHNVCQSDLWHLWKILTNSRVKCHSCVVQIMGKYDKDCIAATLHKKFIVAVAFPQNTPLLFCIINLHCIYCPVYLCVLVVLCVYGSVHLLFCIFIVMCILFVYLFFWTFTVLCMYIYYSAFLLYRIFIVLCIYCSVSIVLRIMLCLFIVLHTLCIYTLFSHVYCSVQAV